MTTILAPPASVPASAPVCPPKSWKALQDHRGLAITCPFSQLNLMRSCPKKFELQYVLNAPKDFIPVSLIYGGDPRVLATLLPRQVWRGSTLSADEMLQAYHYRLARKRPAIRAATFAVKFGGQRRRACRPCTCSSRTIAAFLASPLAISEGHRPGHRGRNAGNTPPRPP